MWQERKEDTKFSQIIFFSSRIALRWSFTRNFRKRLYLGELHLVEIHIEKVKRSICVKLWTAYRVILKTPYSVDLSTFKMKLVLKKLVFWGYVIAIASAHSNRPKRSSARCGVSKGPTGFIVRGQRFSRGDFPWIVALLHTRDGPPSFFCGGTLISSTFVVSGKVNQDLVIQIF